MDSDDSDGYERPLPKKKVGGENSGKKGVGHTDDSSDESDGYEHPLPCGKCSENVQFVCKSCDSTLCHKCVREHVSDRTSGSHDVKYHRSFRKKMQRVYVKKTEHKPEEVHVVKCIVDGWKMSGKTSMIKAYMDGACPNFDTIHPTTHEVHSVSIKHQDQEFCIKLYDMPTCEWYGGLRKLFFKEIIYDVFILCIPIDFVNLESESKFLLKELHANIPDPPPIIVIGTKIDLRESNEKRKSKLLTSEELRRFAQTINAVSYHECSAVKNENFADILQEIAMIYLSPNKGKKERRHLDKPCLLM